MRATVAAVLMLALGENYGGKIFAMLDDDVDMASSQFERAVVRRS